MASAAPFVIHVAARRMVETLEECTALLERAAVHLSDNEIRALRESALGWEVGVISDGPSQHVISVEPGRSLLHLRDTLRTTIIQHEGPGAC